MSEVVYDEVVTETCCVCGMRFPMFASFERYLRRYSGGKDERGAFYCPKGHNQHYIGESDGDRAKRLAAELSAARQREETLRHHVKVAEQKRKAEVTKRKRIEKRVANGVCPCCKRTFIDLQRHMKSKHPEFSAN